jgi:hypothetical protein
MNGSSDTVRRAGLLAVAGGAAAAVVAAGRRLAASRRAGAPGRPDRQDRTPDLPTHRCDCGAEYRVSGTDRHRVFWPVDAPEDAPVLGDDCVECGAPLPGGRTTSSS